MGEAELLLPGRFIRDEFMERCVEFCRSIPEDEIVPVRNLADVNKMILEILDQHRVRPAGV